MEQANQGFDLIVGANGAWSRTRPLVSPARPIYSGVMFVQLGIDDVDAKHPDIARLVGRGLMFAVGDSKALIGHRDANAHVGIYAALRVPEDAADLAIALTTQPDWQEAVKKSETAMFTRAEEAAAGAWDAIDEVFSEDGLSHILRQMEGQRG